MPALGLGLAPPAAPAPAQTMRDNVTPNLLGAQDLAGSYALSPWHPTVVGRARPGMMIGNTPAVPAYADVIVFLMPPFLTFPRPDY